MNPIIQTEFTADPSPVVFKDARYKDRLFLYTSHDAPNADWFVMDHLMCYSTTDMVNWEHHGSVMTSSDFAWAKKNTLWASQVIDRNGKFYAYIPIEIEGKGPQIGVGISDSPFGPFEDAIGKPLISGNWTGDIDPTIFIDDDGQAYMYWGNPQLKYVKLKESMIEVDGDVVHIPMTEESFGPRVGGLCEEGKWPTAYEEGPWLLKRPEFENPYYLFYAGGKLPEHLAYATAPTPTGPWTFGNILIPAQEGTVFTIHPGVTDYKGKSYMFYHCGRLTELEGFTGGFTRSTSVEEFKYEADGQIKEIPITAEGPAPVGTLNPYEDVAACTINWCEKIRTTRSNPDNRKNHDMTAWALADGAYIKVANVDFGNPEKLSFAGVVQIADSVDAVIEIRSESIDGPLLGQLEIPKEANEHFEATLNNLTTIEGIQDIYFIFKGNFEAETLGLKRWKFSK